MQTQYFLIINEQQAGPFSKEDLASRHITSETLVWRAGLPDWTKASAIPELADITAIETGYEDLGTGEDTRWFAMINDRQTGPYTIETLISMGLTPRTPVWRNGMADWTEAASVPEIMKHFSSTPPPHHGFSQNPGYANPDFNRQNRYEENPSNNGYNNGFNNRYNNNNGWGKPQQRINWLPWAIVATIVGFCFSCVGAIFGIIGIVNANKANEFYQTGNDSMGDQANNTAKIMTIIGFVLAGIGLIGTGFFYRNSLF